MRHLRPLFSVLIALSLLSISAPVAARTAPGGVRPEFSNRASLEVIDVAGLARALEIPASAGTLTAVTANRTGKEIAMLFVKDGAYSIYRGRKAVITARPLSYGKTLPDIFPSAFFFTENGYLIHSANPTELFVNDHLATSAANSYVYANGADTLSIDRDTLYFPETSSIRSYHLGSGLIKTVYDHPGMKVLHLRRNAKDLYYALEDADGKATLYRNGSQFLSSPLDNPVNFVITKKRDVYTFAEAAGGYEVRKNDRVVFAGKGHSGFLYVDPEDRAWHVGYTVGEDGFDVRLYRDFKPHPIGSLGDIEGHVAFSGHHSAFRAAFQDNAAFYLIKNGNKTGQPFQFYGKRDNGGIKFSSVGKTYMRNYIGGRWRLFEDGRLILGDDAKDVWFIGIDGKKVRIYATKK